MEIMEETGLRPPLKDGRGADVCEVCECNGLRQREPSTICCGSLFIDTSIAGDPDGLIWVTKKNCTSELLQNY